MPTFLVVQRPKRNYAKAMRHIVRVVTASSRTAAERAATDDATEEDNERRKRTHCKPYAQELKMGTDYFI